jgi:hypothetical protein
MVVRFTGSEDNLIVSLWIFFKGQEEPKDRAITYRFGDRGEKLYHN